MKKMLTLAMVLALFAPASFAGFGSSLKNAVKSDVKATKTAVKSDVKATKTGIKNAVKTDIENSKKAQTAAATAKKTEKLNKINSKLTELNNELTTVKNSKELTETEKTIRTRAIQRQIEFYNKQKAALQ